MKTISTVVCALWAMLAVPGVHAGGISDIGVNAYWGADGHGYGDVIGSSTYNINGATITRAGSVLTITIATNFAGHAGSDLWAAPALGGIGYGDVFLSQVWNPFGSDANHINDNAANGTKWSYGLNLNTRMSNTGGTFELYQLNGATNASNILNSNSFITCGTSCSYRNGQATAVNTSSSTVKDTGVQGTWTVIANQQIQFTLDMTSTSLLNFSSFAMHWGETCQNDVVEGITRVLPLPGSVPLVAIGLGAMLVLRRRQAGRVALKA
jgi:hypothetical protein